MNLLSYHLLPLAIAYLLLMLANEIERAIIGSDESGRIHTEVSTDHCSWKCHDQTTSHCLPQHGGLPESFRETVKPFYAGMVQFLMSTGNYKSANLQLLALIWPLLMSLLLMRLARGLEFAQKWRQSKLPTLLLGVAVAGGAFVLAKSNPYDYLTDFTLTLSRWLSLSYFDVNALIFIIAWPLSTLLLLTLSILQLVTKVIRKP